MIFDLLDFLRVVESYLLLFSLSLTLCHTHSVSLSLSLSHTHTHTHTLTHTQRWQSKWRCRPSPWQPAAAGVPRFCWASQKRQTLSVSYTKEYFFLSFCFYFCPLLFYLNSIRMLIHRVCRSAAVALTLIWCLFFFFFVIDFLILLFWRFYFFVTFISSLRFLCQRSCFIMVPFFFSLLFFPWKI